MDQPNQGVWHNPVAGANHLTRRQEKRIHVYRRIDHNGFNWLVWAVAASGFFTDSYNLFATNVILSPLAFVYWPEDRATAKWFELTANIATLSGSIVGQLSFGYLADRFGRTRLYGFELIIVIFSTIGFAQSAAGVPSASGKLNDYSMSIISSLLVWRFIMGTGIGAEYPLSAVLTAEWAPKGSRARMLAAVFLMQPAGQLWASLVGLFTLLGIDRTYGLRNSTEPQNVVAMVDRIWRWVTGVGALPAFVAIVFRLTITDPGRYTLDVMNDPDRAVSETDRHYHRAPDTEVEMEELGANGEPAQEQADDDEEILPVPFSKADLQAYFIDEGNWRYLAGTSACWFLLDLAFFGLGVNSHHTLTKVWASQKPDNQTLMSNLPSWNPDPTHPHRDIYQVLMNNIKQSIITVSIGSLIGSAISIVIIDRIPRKKILAWSFLLLAMFLLITGGVFLATFETPRRTATIVLYAFCQALFNLGPNTLTFVIPAEIFPTRYRCTCHGISAAAGKLGSVLIQLILYFVWGSLKDYNKDSRQLGFVLIGFSFVMALGFLFAWAWIPDVQGLGTKRGRRVLVSKSLEVLAEGKRRAERDGQIIGFRAKFGRLWRSLGRRWRHH